MTELHPKAKALIHLAKRGQEPSPEELRAVMHGFHRRTREPSLTDVSLQTPAHGKRSSVERRRGAVATCENERTSLRPSGYRKPELRKHLVKWSLVAAMMTGSLGALANWNVVVQQVSQTLSTLVEEALEVIPARARGKSKISPRPASGATDHLAPNVPSRNDVVTPLHVPGATPVAAEPVAREPVAAEPVAREPSERTPSERSHSALVETTAALPRRIAPPPGSSRQPTEVLPTTSPHVRTTSVLSEREVILIAAARSTLAAGNFPQTRRLLDEHQLGFPNSALAEERETLRALTACRESGDATLAQRYILRRPQSLFSSRLIRECGLTPSPAAAPSVPQ